MNTPGYAVYAVLRVASFTYGLGSVPYLMRMKCEADPKKYQ